MIEKALKYINSLKTPEIREIGGQTYSDKQLFRISHNPKAQVIKLNSLTSLVQYLLRGWDKTDSKKLFIHVVSPTSVHVFSQMDDECERNFYLEVNALLPEFRYNTFIDHDEFCIGLQAKFKAKGDRDLLLKFAGTVVAGSVSEYGDDGVTQKATVKTGVASKADVVVPNPVKLTAYRTFLEVPQPEATYVFRMKEGKYGPVQCALFECDGGAWQLEAKESILRYLTSELQDLNNILILS